MMARKKQNKPEFMDARKQIIAQLRAHGSTREMASEQATAVGAGASTTQIGRWERDDDAEYWHWYKKAERQFVREASAEALRQLRGSLRTRLSQMADDEILAFMEMHNMNRYEFETLVGKEQERVIKAGSSIRSDDARRAGMQMYVDAIDGHEGGTLAAELLHSREEALPPPPAGWGDKPLAAAHDDAGEGRSGQPGAFPEGSSPHIIDVEVVVEEEVDAT